MKIAILGAGNIGGTLGGKWTKAGHDVCFGVRDAQSLPRLWRHWSARPGAVILGVSAAIRESDLVLFSVPWKIVPEIAGANTADLNTSAFSQIGGLQLYFHG